MEKAHKTVEVSLPSPSGILEAVLMLPVPESSNYEAAAVVCHPHPLYGGSMNSKVVVTAAHAILEMGIPSLRFNFRGVGRSSGKYDRGIGEQDDVRAAVTYMAGKAEKIIVIGHSFGALAGMRAGCGDARVRMMIGIGTPVADMSFLMDCTKPEFFIHGMLDELIPVEEVVTLCGNLPEPKRLIKVEGADHLFTGKLGEVSEAVKNLVREYLPV